tara:strand:+ start:139 stop:552 length:414 start_codon:yes stop_codon:yes gene_type:complete
VKKNTILILIIFSTSILYARTFTTTLKDYAYDFSTIGYEISFPASSGYYSSMNAGDYFNAKDDGYTIKVRIEGLSRNNRRDFVSYYNENCKVDYTQETCPMIVEGEVELDDSMSMILTAKKIDFYNSDRTKIIKSFD